MDSAVYIVQTIVQTVENIILANEVRPLLGSEHLDLGGVGHKFVNLWRVLC